MKESLNFVSTVVLNKFQVTYPDQTRQFSREGSIKSEHQLLQAVVMSAGSPRLQKQMFTTGRSRQAASEASSRNRLSMKCSTGQLWPSKMTPGSPYRSRARKKPKEARKNQRTSTSRVPINQSRPKVDELATVRL